MTETLSARLEELASKATKGPWQLHTDLHFYPDEAILGGGGENVLHSGIDGEPRHGHERFDISLIVELVNNLPEIIAALKERGQ